VHTAWQDATPLVLLVGLVPVADRDRESFQEFSLTGWFGSTAKRVLTVETADRAAEQLAEDVLGRTVGKDVLDWVAERSRGVIRRIMATPIPRRNYIAAHVLQRLILAVVQVLILLAVAVLAFKVTVVGGLGALLLVAVLGAVVFLCLGFAVTGLLTTENQAAVATQIVTLPQLFLSGVFFSRDAVPAFLKPVADYLPLTFLNDALRAIATTGATLGDVGGQIVGLLVWAVVSFILAYRLFRLD